MTHVRSRDLGGLMKRSKASQTTENVSVKIMPYRDDILQHIIFSTHNIVSHCALPYIICFTVFHSVTSLNYINTTIIGSNSRFKSSSQHGHSARTIICGLFVADNSARQFVADNDIIRISQFNIILDPIDLLSCT